MEVHCDGCWEHACICPPKKKSNLATKATRLELQVVALETENSNLKARVHKLNGLIALIEKENHCLNEIIKRLKNERRNT